MYQQERMDEIVKILEEKHYVTVNFLVKEIKYSPASIRRDLTILEKRGIVKRSYGGVSLRDANHSPFQFRQHSMKIAKNAMAKKAAELVKDRDVVFIDGSSTTQYLGHFLIDKKDITVITSNMTLAGYLSENGINVYCTGGKVIEAPGILGGEIMLSTLSKFHADIAFFSSTSFSTDGKILTPSEMEMSSYHVFREHAKRLVYLCASDKFDTKSKFVGLTLDDVDYFVTDAELPETMKQKHASTTFICVK